MSLAHAVVMIITAVIWQMNTEGFYRATPYDSGYIPENMRRWSIVGLLLGQRRRRWANSKPTLVQQLMFAGIIFTSAPLWKLFVGYIEWTEMIYFYGVFYVIHR